MSKTGPRPTRAPSRAPELSALWSLVLCTVGTLASQYDPHRPDGNPWFEGWYTRISRTSTGLSIGIIAGYYPDASRLRDPAAYVALLLDHGQGRATTLQAYPKAVTVSVGGHNLTKNPDLKSPPAFSFADSDGIVQLRQEGETQTLRVRFPEARTFLEATLSEPEPWDSRGVGPEGWAGVLPFLGLHWFVYSTGSKVAFNLTSPQLGTVSGTGSAHQEKNWGSSFPGRWIWANAIGSGRQRLVLTGGFTPWPFEVFIVGYHSKALRWDFHPLNPSVFRSEVDACAGVVRLTASGLGRQLRIRMQLDPERSGGLFTVAGPTRSGFKADSVENFRATIEVEAYSGILHQHLEERVRFTDAALEFGGDYRCGPHKARRVRRELRSLAPADRDRVFAAMDVLKQTPTPVGRARYGPRFVSYDELVAQHLAVSAGEGCDQAHLGPAFATFHRAFGLRFEEALLAVDPGVEALPYWDYNVEARRVDPRHSEIWDWFGSSDPSGGHTVRDGRFAHWRVRAHAGDISNLTNPHGLLRSPWNVNPSPHLTRSGSTCGAQTKFDTEYWERCLQMPLYLAWYACIDPTVHTWAHSFLGGIWAAEHNTSRVECFLINAIGVPALWRNRCLQCSAGCTDDPANGGCGSCVIPDAEVGRCLVGKLFLHRAPIYGDFADAWASPNDPIFFFHHANVDRHLMTWQQGRRHWAPHYGFPGPSVPCGGHGLRDVVAPAWPFDAALLRLPPEHGSLTNADLMAVDGLAETNPYTYDSLVAVQPRAEAPEASEATVLAAAGCAAALAALAVARRSGRGHPAAALRGEARGSRALDRFWPTAPKDSPA